MSKRFYTNSEKEEDFWSDGGYRHRGAETRGRLWARKVDGSPLQPLKRFGVVLRGSQNRQFADETAHLVLGACRAGGE